MGSSFFLKSLFLMLIIVMLLCASFLAWFLIRENALNDPATSHAGGNSPARSAFAPESSFARPKSVPPTIAPKNVKRPDFQAGMVFPEWDATLYSSPAWQAGLQQIQAQTGAWWIEIPLLFAQPSLTSTTVSVGENTPTLASFTDAIRTAHALGFQVFVVPLIKVGGPMPWSGDINFASYQQEQQWFASYWQTYEPYVAAARQNGVEQVAIGTEDDWLQENASASLWNDLIANIHEVFPGTLTYDMNWNSQFEPVPPSWLSNPLLKMIGFSEYIPLVDAPIRVDPGVMPALWAQKVKPILDTLAAQLGKPVLITEIGYGDTADALYQPYAPQSNAPLDASEQAGACEAALENVVPDPNIAGIYFWGWDNVEEFDLSGQPAVAVIHKWYSSPQI